MLIENQERSIKCEPAENGKFKVTSIVTDLMDAEAYLKQINGLQGALDQEKQHQITLPEKVKNDLNQIESNIKVQTKFLEEFKKNEELAKSLIPKEEVKEEAKEEAKVN